MKHSVIVKETLFDLISEMEQYRWLFVRNPITDFTRVKKWSFSETMKFMITMQGNSLKTELYNYFDYCDGIPTNSSFNQRRAQILPEAFEFLFKEFTMTLEQKLYRGYRLLACDGSKLCIAHNPKDKSSYLQTLPTSKGYNQLHLNALYDLMTHIYTDAIIQPARQQNEGKAMCDMIDRYSSAKKAIFIADRGYESYNIIAHACEQGQYYLIRTKNPLSTGIISSFREELPTNTETFDQIVAVTLTRKQTKEVKNNHRKYRILTNMTSFDYLDLYDNRFYDLQMRIVRFPISDTTYEYIITNLPPDEFTLENIKELYHMRWGIETSFRELKYAIGLTSFHSKKMDYLKQEIWARLILYNFCEAIIMKTIIVKRAERTRHTYQINYTQAIHICRRFLAIKKGVPPDVEKLISRELLPVRPGRQDPRKVRAQASVSFLYRVA